MNEPAGVKQTESGFLKRLKRLIPFTLTGRYRDEWDADALAGERRFLAERRADLERELERRVDDLTYRYKALAQTIRAFAKDPLPDVWGTGGPKTNVAASIRPLRRELEVLDALDAAIARRSLTEVLEGAIGRVEEEIMADVRQARPAELYGDSYWSDELVEQILSHLLHLWAQWLRREASSAGEGSRP